LEWYGQNARDLPWRRTQDPYSIWVSEAMLQQTQVETVIDYYRRFLEAFPDVASLARAPEEQVLGLWSGLGYYRRARSLQAAARIITDQHAGQFPRDEAAALALPGVGRYTAGAVLSIAYDLPQPLVDGNVERVFSRMFGLDLVAGSRELVRHCWDLAQHLVPKCGAGDWNQALMELGATVCTPRRADCSPCPLRRSCLARRAGRVDELPRAKQRALASALEVEMLVIRRKGKLLLERRPVDQALGGLWQLPTRAVAGAGNATSKLFESDWASGLRAREAADLGRLRHSITRFAIQARILPGLARGRRAVGLAWFDSQALASLAVTGMTRKALTRLGDESIASK